MLVNTTTGSTALNTHTHTPHTPHNTLTQHTSHNTTHLFLPLSKHYKPHLSYLNEFFK
jgi:hypothetical protein